MNSTRANQSLAAEETFMGQQVNVTLEPKQAQAIWAAAAFGIDRLLAYPYLAPKNYATGRRAEEALYVLMRAIREAGYEPRTEGTE